MASLWKHPKSQFWTACFTTGDGAQKKRSTGVRISPLAGDNRKPADLKREALRVAQEYESAARTTRALSQTRDVIADLHERLTGQAIPQRTARQAAEAWLAAKLPEVTDSTKVFYTNSIAKWLQWLGAAADADVNRITRDLVTRYRNELASRLSVASVNHDLGVVKSYLKHCRREGWLHDNPAEFVDKLKRRHDSALQRRPFTRDELRAVIDVCPPEWRSMVLFGVYTGQRLGDLRRMKWDNIDLNLGMIRFRTSKTGRQQHIPIAAPLRVHLESLPRVSEYLHPRLAKLQPVTASGQFADILAAAGLREKKRHRAHHGKGRDAAKTMMALSFHSLRHTAVTMLKEAGVPAALVMEIIGHDSALISQHYTHIGDDVLAAAMAKMPQIVPQLPDVQFPDPDTSGLCEDLPEPPL
jgi:integrase